MLESPTVEEKGESGMASGARKSGDFIFNATPIVGVSKSPLRGSKIEIFLRTGFPKNGPISEPIYSVLTQLPNSIWCHFTPDLSNFNLARVLFRSYSWVEN